MMSQSMLNHLKLEDWQLEAIAGTEIIAKERKRPRKGALGLKTELGALKKARMDRVIKLV